jgi:hypothetical protein
MIKKNMLQYLLIIVVLLIWGRVILKLFKNFKWKEPVEVTQVQLTDDMDDYKLSDTFHISENYPDPFLSEVIHVAKQESSTPKTSISKPIEKPMVVTNWPSISYKGIIKSLSTGKELILIYINDRGYKMSPGNKQGDLILERVYKDSIIMKMNNLKKTIKK